MLSAPVSTVPRYFNPRVNRAVSQVSKGDLRPASD
jgi:hypothetical protein